VLWTAAITAGDIVLIVVGCVMIVLGVRGPPGMNRLPSRPGVAGTWRHGVLVLGAIFYAITVPTLGVLVLYRGLV
jgi:hypothetical protein